jgi:hypothetical protein
MDQLKERHRLIDLGNGSWAVSDGIDPIGVVGFRSGRLVYASRQWTQVRVTEAEDSVKVARGFHGVLTKFLKEGRRTCTIGTHDTLSPEGDFRTAYLVCGGKEIRVMLSASDRFGSSVTIEEVIPGRP